MGDRIRKVTTHLKENKTTYLIGAGGAVVGAAVSIVLIGRSESGSEISQKIVQIVIGNRSNAVVINLIEKSTPSKPVHLVGTDLYFNSLNDAARKTGHHLSQLSKHINGQLPDLGGDVFELLNLAA